MFYAIRANKIEIVQLLLEHGSALNVGKQYALQIAVNEKRGLCCQILLNFGAERPKLDFNGRNAIDPLCELILGSVTIPTGKNTYEVTMELNDIISKEYIEVHNELNKYKDVTIAQDNEDFREFLRNICNVKRRMNRFQEYLQKSLQKYKEKLDKIHQELQSKDTEVWEIKDKLISSWDEQLKNSLKYLRDIQNDLFTPNGNEALERWNTLSKNRMQFLIGLVTSSSDNSKKLISQYTKLKTRYDSIEDINYELTSNKIIQFDDEILAFVAPLTKLSLNTSKILKNLKSLISSQ